MGTLAILQASLLPGEVMNPGIGTKKCFLSWETGSQPLFLYYIPVLLLMIANSANFIMVVVFIVRSKKKTSVARKSSHRTSTVKEPRTSRVNDDAFDQLVLSTKLFFVLGLLWSFEGI